MTQTESGPDQEQPRDWYFTFGHGQRHGPNGYCKIYGKFNGAREEMIRRYGMRWCMQYESADAAGVERFGLTEVHS